MKPDLLKQFCARYRYEMACGACLLAMCAVMLAVNARKGLTNDEFYRLPAGYYCLTEGAFRLNGEHPPLAKIVAAAPVMQMNLSVAPAFVHPNEQPITRGHYAFVQFWEDNLSRLREIAFVGRVSMILVTGLLGALIFIYARRQFDKRAALFAVLLFALEPNLLAHGRLIHNDVPAAFGLLLILFALQLYDARSHWRRTVFLGFAVGLAVTIKFSLLPVAFVCWVGVLAWRGARQFIVARNLRRRGLVYHALAVGVALLCVNLAYGFERAPVSAEDIVWLRAAGVAGWQINFLLSALMTNLLPPSFLLGILVVGAHNTVGHSAFLLGNYSTTGWWYYFPVAFAFKTTLAFLLVSLAGLTSVVRQLFSADGRRRYGILLSGFAVYLLLALTGHINIGVRHILPLFPVLCICGGALLARLWRHENYVKLARAVVIACFAFMLFETARVFPDYLNYVNQLKGSRANWEILSDSNVEWGEDTPALAAYLRSAGETRVRAALAGQPLALRAEGIEYVDYFATREAAATTPNDLPRYVAVGASFLNGASVPPNLLHADGTPFGADERHNLFAAYRTQTPVAVFGDSIYLFVATADGSEQSAR